MRFPKFLPLALVMALMMAMPAIAAAQESDGSGPESGAGTLLDNGRPFRVVVLDDHGELFTGQVKMNIGPLTRRQKNIPFTENPFVINLPAGEYLVEIVEPAGQFETTFQQVRHGALGDTRVEFRQAPLIRGRAMFTDDRPFAERELRFFSIGARVYNESTVKTDADGRFEIRLAPSTYEVSPRTNPRTVEVKPTTAGQPPFLGLAIEPYSPNRGDISSWHSAGVDFEGPFTLPTVFARLQFDFDDYTVALDTLHAQIGFNLPLIGDPASGIEKQVGSQPWTESRLALFAMGSATLAREGISFGRMDWLALGLTLRLDGGSSSERESLQLIGRFNFAAEQQRVMNDVDAMIDLRYSITSSYFIPLRLIGTLGAGIGDQSFFKIAGRLEITVIGLDFEWRISDRSDAGRMYLTLIVGSIGANAHGFLFVRLFGNLDYAIRLGIGGAIF